MTSRQEDASEHNSAAWLKLRSFSLVIIELSICDIYLCFDEKFQGEGLK